MWLEIFLSLVVAVIAVAFVRTYRSMRAKLAAVDHAREKIQQEETRVFDFLHGLGEALSAEMRSEDIHRLIVEGAMRIVEAHGGAIYLPHGKAEGLRRGFGTGEESIIFDIPAEAEKSPDLLKTFLRWHNVHTGAGLIGEVWQHCEAISIRNDDPHLARPGSPAAVMLAPLVFSDQRL